MFDTQKAITDAKQIHDSLVTELAAIHAARKEGGHLDVARGALEAALEALALHQRLNPTPAS